MSIEYRHNTSSQLDILYHLQNVSSAFVHDLSNRVDVKEYSQKLFSMAEREEAWSGDNLIGLVAYYINQDTQKAFITNVSIDIRFQKQGIATKLLENVKCVAVNERMKLISLEAANDDELIAFYLHNGFSLHKRVMDSNSELIMHLVPMVVIRCTVYNHEPYLRDCLEGFVMQQTNFPFVAIVHDDASTDNSAAIIREYEEKYPNIIKPIYETENQYSKQDGSLGRIMNAAIEATGAKYVAMCEGDDYWTDPLKLQKQVDFMEANPEYSICFHKVKRLIQQTGEFKDEIDVIDMPGRSTIVDLVEGNYIHTPSALYRIYPKIIKQYLNMMSCLFGDYTTWLLLANKGDIFKFEDIMAVYRVGNGVFSSTKWNTKHKMELIILFSQLYTLIDNDVAKQKIHEMVICQKRYIMDDLKILSIQLDKIQSTRLYKLIRVLTSPMRFVKSYFKRKNSNIR